MAFNPRRLPVVVLCVALALAGLPQAGCPGEPIPLQPGRVTGKVLDGAGKPAVGARVGVLQGVVTELSLVETTLDNCYRTTTDANGAFEVYVPGLGITPRPHSGWSVWARDDARGLIGAVTFGATPKQPLEIRLAPASWVHTSAFDAEGKPMPGLGMSVTLAEVGFTDSRFATDGRGEVRIGPFPADFPLHLQFSGVLDYLALNDDWTNETKPAITLTAGETHELPALRVGVAQGTLRGTVVGEDGRPVAGAKVRTIIPSALPVKTTTDAKGAFAVTGLLPISADLWVLASHPVERLHVAQRLGPTTRQCRLALRPLTSVRGQLADAQGQPVTDAHVAAATFLPVGAGDTEENWLPPERPTPDSARPDAEGFWEIEGLVSGAPYRLFVSNTVLSFDKGRLSFVADADDPVDLGLLMSRN